MQKGAPLVQFSVPAEEKLVSLMKEQNASDHFLRIDVYVTGERDCCKDILYGMGIDPKPSPDDVVEEVGSIKVITDRNNADILRGSQIDYIESAERRGFEVVSPSDHTMRNHFIVLP
jgi:iron-sulfur cluster assembly protein